MKIYVPSYGRAGEASTMDLIEDALIVVPDSQAQGYEEHYPNRVVSIDDAKDGSVARKCNGILDLVDDGELFWMIDDDLLRVHRLKKEEEYSIQEILESHWQAMESFDITYGGFNLTSDPIRYLEYQPFSITKPSYGAVCIRKLPDVRYDEDLGRHEDADYFLQVMKAGGKILRDNRFFFEFECNKDSVKSKQGGGIAGGEDEFEEALQKLIKRWGKWVKLKNGKMNGVKTPRKGP